MTVYECLKQMQDRDLRSLRKWQAELESDWHKDVIAGMILAYKRDIRALDLAIDNLPVNVAGREV